MILYSTFAQQRLWHVDSQQHVLCVAPRTGLAAALAAAREKGQLAAEGHIKWAGRTNDRSKVALQVGRCRTSAYGCDTVPGIVSLLTAAYVRYCWVFNPCWCSA